MIIAAGLGFSRGGLLLKPAVRPQLCIISHPERPPGANPSKGIFPKPPNQLSRPSTEFNHSICFRPSRKFGLAFVSFDTSGYLLTAPTRASGVFHALNSIIMIALFAHGPGCSTPSTKWPRGTPQLCLFIVLTRARRWTSSSRWGTTK